ncbi:MAG: hypothetical protein DBY38_11905 [Clostridium cadaveris]|uniref:Lipoprotein n=1 Tax=Clostridium cadaveris TaxID=1529 RepID=A0A316M4R1_9CLOT|nr:MAG: hypothetical protein DBY38_11905 [Clostridium cadaveris]
MGKKFYKSFLFVILGIFLVTMLSSCLSKDKETKENNIDVFNNKEVINFIDSYMEHLFKEEYDEAKAMHLDLEKNFEKPDNTLKMMGWKTEEISNAVNGAMVKIMVCKNSKENVVSILEQHDINVQKTDDGYKIKDVKISKEEESFKEGENLRIRQKNNVKTNLLIDKSGLPQYAYPKDDKEKIKETQVSPETQFALSSFNYSGGKIAVSSEDKDAFISIVKLEDDLKVQGKVDNMEKKGKGNGGDSFNNNVREIPIGKEILPLDLIKDAQVELLIFSKDEKFLMIQYKDNSGATKIRCYNSDSGDLIVENLSSEFPSEKYDIFFERFDESNLYLSAREKEYNDVENKVAPVSVKINLKDFKIEK